MANQKSTLRTYYYLTKPGIVYGNAVTALAGFALAAQAQLPWQFPWATGLLMLLGLSLVVASACVINNFIDRDIDAHMTRTKRRPTVQGTISFRAGLTIAAVLGITGLLILIVFTSWVAAALALFGLVTYAAVYTPSKRTTAYSTIIGSLPGAMPPVIGYTAITGRLDATAGLLFLFLACWQIPHFYAIGIMRLGDYQAAHLPIWPLSHGLPSTKRQIIIFTAAFTIVALALPILGYTGLPFLALAVVLCARWLWLGWKGFTAPNDSAWAKAMFKRSLGVLVILSLWMIVFPH
jgi:protoheme IX farnesyltransferase